MLKPDEVTLEEFVNLSISWLKQFQEAYKKDTGCSDQDRLSFTEFQQQYNWFLFEVLDVYVFFRHRDND
jgi:hypothetical protein